MGREAKRGNVGEGLDDKVESQEDDFFEICSWSGTR
jgi:hypothetical protein